MSRGFDELDLHEQGPDTRFAPADRCWRCGARAPVGGLELVRLRALGGTAVLICRAFIDCVRRQGRRRRAA